MHLPSPLNLFPAEYRDYALTMDIVYDYLRMCKLLKKKINLCFLSGKKIKEEHDRLSAEYTYKHTPTIKIPRDTKFKDLDKCLPDSFEKITTKRRIVQEGTQMHHCVASYASLINKDGCAIYSFLYEGKRYTVEFRKAANAKRYYIRQLYGAWDSDAPLRVWNYVRSFLKPEMLAKTA